MYLDVKGYSSRFQRAAGQHFWLRTWKVTAIKERAIGVIFGPIFSYFYRKIARQHTQHTETNFGGELHNLGM